MGGYLAGGICWQAASIRTFKESLGNVDDWKAAFSLLSNIPSTSFNIHRHRHQNRTISSSAQGRAKEGYIHASIAGRSAARPTYGSHARFPHRQTSSPLSPSAPDTSTNHRITNSTCDSSTTAAPQHLESPNTRQYALKTGGYTSRWHSHAQRPKTATGPARIETATTAIEDARRNGLLEPPTVTSPERAKRPQDGGMTKKGPAFGDHLRLQGQMTAGTKAWIAAHTQNGGGV